MKIIISPAKRMKSDVDSIEYRNLPCYLAQTEKILEVLKELTYEEIKSIWNCNDQIARLNFERIRSMDLYNGLTPAILAYEGIQYRYMAPSVFENKSFEYIQEHLRILSGFYGILKPFDGITPYRLEMQAKLKVGERDSLYDFWGSSLVDKLIIGGEPIINLASKEYSRCISKYVSKDVQFVSCVFGEYVGDKILEKGTAVKMARGEMVRFMAEKQIENLSDIKTFDRLKYKFSPEQSDSNTYVFIKEKN